MLNMGWQVLPAPDDETESASCPSVALTFNFFVAIPNYAIDDMVYFKDPFFQMFSCPSKVSWYLTSMVYYVRISQLEPDFLGYIHFQ